MKMKIGHLNIRSVFTGFNDFKNIIENYDFDVMMLSETWLTSDVDSIAVNIPGYRFIRKDRVGRGGGVASYVKVDLLCDIINFDFVVNDKLEFLFINLKINSVNIAVGVFYRPPNTNINQFINDFDNIFSFLCPTVDEVICVGDFNVDFFNINNPLSSCFDSYNLTQILNEPTRISNRSSTLLDPICVTNKNIVSSYGTLGADNISDHRIVFCDLTIKKNKNEPKFVEYRCFNNFNFNYFLEDMQELPWSNIIMEHNIDDKINIFNNLILALFNKHAPLKKVRVSKPKAPWLTPDLKIFMKQRDLALQKFKQTHLEHDWIEYKRLRNFTLSVVRKEKKKYINSLCDEKNTRKLWSTLKDFNIRSNNNFYNIPQEISNPDEINNFFTSFLQNVNGKSDDKIRFYNNNYYNNDNKFSFKLASVEEVSLILHSLKSNAYGVDGVSLIMLKYCSPFVDKYITHIINCCIERSYFPRLWKQSIGKPLAKCLDPKTFSDLRIISILPTVSKIFEKILHNQIYSYMLACDILPHCQNGFRKHFSTATALSVTTNDIIKAYDNKLESVLVLLDFSKAFDTISHDVICSKLKYYGFDLQSCNLINVYLTGRLQKVFCNDTYSSALDILSGVPQGSILGPLLFIVYTADILKAIQNCTVQAYADDTQVYIHFNHDDYLHATDLVNADLQKIKQVSEEHNLNLNSSKSCVMIFGNRNNVKLLKDNIDIKIDGVSLPIVDSAKNLGLVVDNDFRFGGHVKKMLQKSFMSLKLIYSNRHLLNFKLKKDLCESLVLSNFNYCDFIYGPCLDLVRVNRIQKVQNSCARLIFNLRKYDHVSQSINNLSWLNMKNRRLHHLGNFVINLINEPQSSCSLKNMLTFRTQVHSVNLRNVQRLTMPHHHTALFKKSFMFNAIKLYNSLPTNLLSMNDKQFKKGFKKYLLNSQVNH